MGQALIRNLDDDLLADYREAARRNQRSLEAELREALALVRPISVKRKEQLLTRLAEIRALTPDGVVQTPSEQIVRDDRDGKRE